jgi:signal transduction histidine kinase
LRTRSLFWVFAGVFLAVLAAATVLEITLVVTVLRPLATQRSHERTELALDRAARSIAALYDPYDLAEVGRVLRENRPLEKDADLVLNAWDGRLVVDRELEPAQQARIRAALAVTSNHADSSRVHDDALEVFGRRTVTIEGSRFGEVAALGPPSRVSLLALPETRTLALFLPFAVLASAVAGLFMVRIVVNRLRALEHVALRVTEGELDARVTASGGDEIGRLEELFNRMTERLARARDDLQRTDEQRRQLFADITHELNTPLTSIRGYVETLMNPAVPISPEERAAYLDDVLAEAKRLEVLIAELLDLTRLEAGAAPLRRVRIDWAALSRNATRRLAPRFAEAGLTLEWRGADAPAWVLADGRRLEQVMDNLLGNALRYVPAGGTVAVAMESALERNRESAVARLTVSDDGPGLAAEDLPPMSSSDSIGRMRFGRRPERGWASPSCGRSFGSTEATRAPSPRTRAGWPSLSSCPARLTPDLLPWLEVDPDVVERCSKTALGPGGWVDTRDRA